MCWSVRTLNPCESHIILPKTYLTVKDVTLHLNQLQLALAGDLDLALVPPGQRGCVVQTLFICSGCDLCPFLQVLGKPQ